VQLIDADEGPSLFEQGGLHLNPTLRPHPVRSIAAQADNPKYAPQQNAAENAFARVGCPEMPDEYAPNYGNVYFAVFEH